MTQPGDLRGFVAMQKKGDGDDGYGGVIPEAGPFFSVWSAPARVRYLKGSEEVIAARLQSVQTVVLTMRYEPAFADVTTTWRAVDARAGFEDGDEAKPLGDVFQLKAITPDERKAWVDLLCQVGTVA